MWEDVELEMLRTERECMERVCSKIRAQQLGEAFVGLDIVPNERRGANNQKQAA
jgi:hypothetical protein